MKLLLTDFDHAATKRLKASLVLAGLKFLHVNIHYDGFLSQGVSSPFEKEVLGDTVKFDGPLRYNQLKITEQTELRSLDAKTAELLAGDHCLARIKYAPLRFGRRVIQEVVWLDSSGNSKMGERYNQQGFKFADVLYQKNAQPSKEIYYRSNGTKVLTYNYLTGAILRHKTDGQDEAFENLTDYVINALPVTIGIENPRFSHILINSLSTPLFVANRLASKLTTLYFQEKIQKEIPYNLQKILEGQSTVKRVFFEDMRAYERLDLLMLDEERVKLGYLGALETPARANSFRKKLLTITRSDDLLFVEEFLNHPSLDEYQWTIAAPTNVSGKLRSFANKYPQMRVIEAIHEQDIAELFRNHDIYLNINKGLDYQASVEKAYVAGLLVLGTPTTAKSPEHELVLNEQELLELLAQAPKQAEALRLLHYKKGKPATVGAYQRLFA